MKDDAEIRLEVMKASRDFCSEQWAKRQSIIYELSAVIISLSNGDITNKEAMSVLKKFDLYVGPV